MKDRFTKGYNTTLSLQDVPPPSIQEDAETALRERIRFLGSAGKVEYAARLAEIMAVVRATNLCDSDRALLSAFLNQPLL